MFQKVWISQIVLYWQKKLFKLVRLQQLFFPWTLRFYCPNQLVEIPDFGKCLDASCIFVHEALCAIHPYSMYKLKVGCLSYYFRYLESTYR